MSLPRSHRVLPFEAQQILKRAAVTGPHSAIETTKDGQEIGVYTVHPERVAAVNAAAERVRSKYPQLFRKEYQQ